MQRNRKASVDIERVPQYWSQATDGAGRTVLTYAVRGGKAAALVAALGAACMLGGIWGAYWLVSGGELTGAGWVFIVLVPGGLIAFGVHCLDAVLWRHHEYAMSSHGLRARRRSVWGSGNATDIPRSAVVEVMQSYTPPGPSSPTGSTGTWTTFLSWRDRNGVARDFAFGGMCSPDEARWLGPLLAKWAGKPLRRGHGAGLEEAAPEELPTLDA